MVDVILAHLCYHVLLPTALRPGVVLSALELESAAAMCAAAGAWLILDNTYEDFVYNDSAHHCVCKHNVIHIFSFSKAYGMMGWRVGYIAYPGQKMLQQAGLVDCNLGDEMRKVRLHRYLVDVCSILIWGFWVWIYYVMHVVNQSAVGTGSLFLSKSVWLLDIILL